MLSKLPRHLYLLIALAYFTVGCASTGPDSEFLADIHAYKPKSILIVPVKNETIDVLAPTTVLATLPRLFAERGYYAFPVNTVKTILEYEGYYEPAEVHSLQTETLAQLFGADAVLYVTVHEWDAQYVLFATTTIVDIEYQLRSKTGAPLWSSRQQLSYRPESEDTGSLLGNLISDAISAAFERAAPNFLPLTREAHQNAISDTRRGLPPGPFSRAHDGYYKQLNTDED